MKDGVVHPSSIESNEFSQKENDLDILDRVRLDALFDQALKYPVINVVAGAGYGKSIAVSSYLRKNKLETLWVQLSEKDNMRSHFWETVSQALASLNPSLVNPAQALGFPETEEVLSYFISLLTDERKPRFRYAIVFDDLHLLQEGPVLELIARVCPYVLEDTHIITISRQENFPKTDEFFRNNPPFRVDENDLAFTKNELAEYFGQRGITASPDLIVDIFNDTEGWPFGVSLAARLLDMDAADRTYIRTILKSNFNAIIERELYSVIPEELRHFLLQLSLAKHLSPDLIREFENGEEYMRELSAASSFIRYDHYMHVYRIHHLLLRFLEGKRHQLSEQEQREALEKTARWCAANGYKLDAIASYLQLGDYYSIITLSYSYPFVMPFDVASELLEIFEQAPKEVFENNPDVYYLHARLIMTVGRAEEGIEKSLEYIGILEKLPYDEVVKRTLLALYQCLGFAKLIASVETHDYDFARHFVDAMPHFEAPVDLPEGGFQVYNVGPYALRIGRETAGEPEMFIKTISEVAACTTVTMQGCMHGLDDLVRSEYAYFRDQSAEAERFALSCMSAAHDYGQFEIESRALFLLLRIYLQRGKYEQIMDVLAQLEELTNEEAFPNRFLLYEIISSWFFAMIGVTDKVEPWLRSDLWSKGPSNLFDGLEDTVKSRYYLATRNYRTLIAFIDSRTTRFGISRYLLGKIGLMVCKAVACLQLNERREAFGLLKSAYDLASPNELFMLFIEQGNNMRTLTGTALRELKERGETGLEADGLGLPASWLEMMRSRATTYAKRVAFVRSVYLEKHSPRDDVQITSKELEILTDLSQGLSRTEISLTHGISINTVKSMLQVIYDKLGAESAMDAVRIATTKRIL
jgi:LuxR family maltose regulon positive regulatory protein